MSAPTADTSQARSGTAVLDRLGHPAVGNLCATLAVIVSIATAAGVLRDAVFWLVFGYAAVIGLLSVSLLVSFRRRRLVVELASENYRLSEALALATSERADARKAQQNAVDDHDACEAGYASLRHVIVSKCYDEPSIEDFDDELSAALRKLRRRRQPTGTGR